MSDESLFREVDEEVRRDQMEKLWARYGNYAVAVAVGIILAVAGIKGWNYWQKIRSESAGDAYVNAVQLATANKSGEAAKAFGKLAAGGHKGYAVLSRLQLAAGLAATGKSKEALKAYDAIAGDASVDATLRDIARIRAGYLAADSASLADLRTRLSAFEVAGNPWRNSVREIYAIAAYRAGDYTTADRQLNEIIADPAAGNALRSRASRFISVLAPLLQKNK